MFETTKIPKLCQIYKFWFANLTVFVKHDVVDKNPKNNFWALKIIN